VIGDTAGRTAKHPTGNGAIARSTQRQRAGLAPPPGEPWAIVHTREQVRGQITKAMLISGPLVAIGVGIMIFFVNPWLEMLGIPFFVAGVTVAGLSRPWQRVRQDLILDDRSGPPRPIQRLPARK
jgi:hypothetical protein